jgi:hypothetical protein
VSKFALGAWIVLLLIPAMVAIMLGIRRHYDRVEAALAVDWSSAARAGRRLAPRVIVPIARLDRAALNAVEFARSISGDVTAVHITDDRDEAEEMQRRWHDGMPNVELVVLESPYRALVAPLLTYLDARESHDPDRPLTVVLPEFVPRHLWENLLHNQAALRLKLRLFGRPNTVVVDVPYHVT